MKTTMKTLIANKRPLGLLSAIVCIVLLAAACSSDLLSAPPETIKVHLTADPVETIDTTEVLLGIETSAAVTVSVEYGTTSGEYTNATPRTEAVTTIHSVTLTDLTPGIAYYYRVLSYLGTARTYTSEEYSVTPSSSEPPPTAAQKNRGIWLIGGLSGASVNNIVTTIDLYDPVPAVGYPQGRWFTNIANTSGYTPVSFAGYAAYNGKLYVIGGFDSTGAIQNLVQIYDIATNSWSAGSTMPTPRANIYASVLNGKIYVLSGSQNAATTAWATAPAPSGVCYEYTPGGSWVTKTGYTTTSNTERVTYAYGNTLYSLGGRSAAAAVASVAHDGYIPSLSALTSATTELALNATGSVLRTGISVVVCQPTLYDHSLVVIGGISTVSNTTGSFINFPTTASGVFSNQVNYLAYPFASPATWRTASNTFPGTGIAFGTAVLSKATGSDRIYYFGGTGVLGTSAAGSVSVRWIDTPQPPATWGTSWTTLSSAEMNPGRWGHGAVTLNN